MIDKKTIRYGNWVMYGDNPDFKEDFRNRPVQIDYDIMAKLFSHEEEEFRYNPIPLSEEVLVKCGFVHKGGWMGKSFITQIYEEDVEIVFEFMDEVLNVYAADQRVAKLESPALHELMNLFYSLTKEELVYKP